MENRKELLKGTKRVVVKFGTTTLTNHEGQLNYPKIAEIVKELTQLLENGYEVIVVSSGAVGAGMGVLQLSEKPKAICEKQAVAAIGQVELIQLYQKLFRNHGVTIGQLLLTKNDFSRRVSYLNARNVCRTLLAKKIIPIINENDSVVADEIKVGDNDTLSALVAGLIDADMLIIVSDIDGLYDKNPQTHPDAKLLSYVPQITKTVRKSASGEGSKFGTGGMHTKIIAAEMATKNGTNLAIINGENPNNITKLLAGAQIGTVFAKQDKKIPSRKYWLAYSSVDDGVISIDAGAENALKQRKSLLPVGVKKVMGKFDIGAVIAIQNQQGDVIAKGITNYTATEIIQIKGTHSEDIEKILGYKYDDVIIHIDNLILL
jgi:glutamate 5-kinase